MDYLGRNFSRFGDLLADLGPGTTEEKTTVPLTSGLVENILHGLALLLGVAGNTVLCTQYFASCRKGSNTSCSEYVGVIAFASLSFLVPLFINFMLMVSRSSVHGYICRWIMFLCFFGCFLCSWAVLAFTAERLVVVYRPFYRCNLTVRRSRILLVGIVFSSLAYNGWILVAATHSPESPSLAYCAIHPEFTTVGQFYERANMFVLFFVPAVGIVVMNFFIVVQIGRYCKPRGTFSGFRLGDSRRRNCGPGPSTRRIRHERNSQRRAEAIVTARLLFASAMYVLLNGPFFAWQIVKDFVKGGNKQQMFTIEKWFQLLLVVQFAINCLVYGRLPHIDLRILKASRFTHSRGCAIEPGYLPDEIQQPDEIQLASLGEDV